MNVSKWLSRAVSTDKVRDYLKYVFIKNGKATSTNGYMVFQADTPQLEDGGYIASKEKLIKAAEWSSLCLPNFGKVIPSDDLLEPTGLTISTTKDSVSLTSCLIQIRENTSKALDYKLLERVLLPTDKSKGTFEVFHTANMVVFKNTMGALAVVAPIRV